MLPELSTFSYEERLERTGIFSLEMCRLRADFLEVFKIVQGLESTDQSVFFELSEDNRTRRHQLKSKMHHCRLIDVRKCFFSQRIISEWNNLPKEAMCDTTVNSFESKIDPVLWKRRGLYINQKRLPAPVFTTSSTVSAGGLRWAPVSYRGVLLFGSATFRSPAPCAGLTFTVYECSEEV